MRRPGAGCRTGSRCAEAVSRCAGGATVGPKPPWPFRVLRVVLDPPAAGHGSGSGSAKDLPASLRSPPRTARKSSTRIGGRPVGGCGHVPAGTGRGTPGRRSALSSALRSHPPVSAAATAPTSRRRRPTPRRRASEWSGRSDARRRCARPRPTKPGSRFSAAAVATKRPSRSPPPATRRTRAARPRGQRTPMPASRSGAAPPSRRPPR